MSNELAGLLVLAAAGFLAVGVVFAIVFDTRLAGRLDPAAARGTWGFRVLHRGNAAMLEIASPPTIQSFFR